MNTLLKNKTLTGVIVLAAFIVLGFLMYSWSSPSTPASNPANDAVSQQLLITLSNLHTIRLNGSIFSNPAFVSLTDFGVVIPPQPAGRRNPFLPASAGSAPTQTTTKTTTR